MPCRKVPCRPLTFVRHFAMFILFSSVFEKDPNGVDSTVSSNHRTRNLLEFSAHQESSTAQKIPEAIVSEKSNRWDQNLFHILGGRGHFSHLVLLALTALLTLLASALAAFTEYLSSKHSVLKASQFAFQMNIWCLISQSTQCVELQNVHVAVLHGVREELIHKCLSPRLSGPSSVQLFAFFLWSIF